MATAMVFATPYHQSRRAIGNSSDTNRQKQEIYNETERLLGNLTVRKQELGVAAEDSLLDTYDANFVLQDEEKEKYVQKPMEKRMSCKVCLKRSPSFLYNLNLKLFKFANVLISHSLPAV